MKKYILVSAVLFCSPQATAQTPASPATTATTVAIGESKVILNWTGDLRFRAIQAAEADDDRRYYQQIRARLGVGADVNESMKLKFRLATATSPISSNQQLGKDPGMVRRGFGLDLAFLDWRMGDLGNAWLGRTPNPFWSPANIQTVFDGDIAFEGLAFKFEPKRSEASLFLNLGAFIIAESYSAPEDSSDSALVGAEVGYQGIKTDWKWRVHAANFHYLSVKDRTITSIQTGSSIDSYSAPFTSYRGNTVYASGATHRFENEYTLAVVGGEVAAKLPADAEVGAFLEVVRNYAVGSKGLAIEGGLTGKRGDLSLSLARIDKEADSVFAAFSDSDANGGGTDNSGYRFGLSYQVAKNCSLAGTHYIADRGMDTTTRDFDSTHLDLMAEF